MKNFFVQRGYFAAFWPCTHFETKMFLKFMLRTYRTKTVYNNNDIIIINIREKLRMLYKLLKI